MARLNPENVFVRTVDNFDQPTQHVGTWVYNDLKLYREFAGSTSPGYPRNLTNNEYHLVMKKVHDFGYVDCFRWNIAQPNLYWDHETSENPERQASQRCIFPLNWPYLQNDVSHDISVQNRAINGAMDNLRDAKVNLAQVIAERKQTVDLVHSTITRLHDTMRLIRKGNIKGAANALGVSANPKRMSKDFGKIWLELQYGWKPLLSDVKGAAESLARSMISHPIIISGEKVAKLDLPEFSGELYGRDYGYFLWKWGKLEHVAKCKLIFQVRNDFTRQGAMLGLTDPLTLAWELLPYSFVIDWFIPIGNFLSRLSYNDGLDFKTGYLSLLSRQEVSIGPVSGTWKWGTGGMSRLSGRPTRKVNLRVARLVYAHPPLPTLPAFKDPFSVVHVTNALALWSSGFRKVRDSKSTAFNM